MPWLREPMPPDPFLDVEDGDRLRREHYARAWKRMAPYLWASVLPLITWVVAVPLTIRFGNAFVLLFACSFVAQLAVSFRLLFGDMAFDRCPRCNESFHVETRGFVFYRRTCAGCGLRWKSTPERR
jgi:hypothetical protein